MKNSDIKRTKTSYYIRGLLNCLANIKSPLHLNHRHDNNIINQQVRCPIGIGLQLNGNHIVRGRLSACEGACQGRPCHRRAGPACNQSIGSDDNRPGTVVCVARDDGILESQCIPSSRIAVELVSQGFCRRLEKGQKSYQLMGCWTATAETAPRRKYDVKRSNM